MKKNDQFRHRRTGDEYVVEDCLMFKHEGQWVPDGLVVYASTFDGSRYARLTKDFLQAFEELK